MGCATTSREKMEEDDIIGNVSYINSTKLVDNLLDAYRTSLYIDMKIGDRSVIEIIGISACQNFVA